MGNSVVEKIVFDNAYCVRACVRMCVCTNMKELEQVSLTEAIDHTKYNAFSWVCSI